VTVLWSLMASACLTLAAIYFGAWWKARRERAYLPFALAAASMTAFAAGELWMMRAATPDELLTAIRWSNVPLYSWLMCTVWFVAVYLGTGRRWLLWSIVIVRTISLIVNFYPGPSLTYTAMAPLQHITFLGEAVTVPTGTPNPWLVVSQLSSVMILIFVADASITAWRKGERRKALLVGGSIEFSFLTALVSAMPVTWGGAQAPFIFSVPFMVPVLVMGNELTRAVMRASQLLDALTASEAGLRDQQARLQASHHQISDLFGRLIATQETERTRIARDLHDDVGQRIAGIGIAVSSLKRRLGSGQGDPTVAALTSMQRDLTALAEEIRHVSHELHPTQLQHAGLGPALSAVCKQFGKRHGIAAVCRANDELGPIGDEAALGLFRVAQESLRNVSKHAGATEVEVALTATADVVRLTIADNGKGFDLAAARQRSGGLGLLSIDERVRLLQGTVDITTAPGAGTMVRVQVPARATP